RRTTASRALGEYAPALRRVRDHALGSENGGGRPRGSAARRARPGREPLRERPGREPSGEGLLGRRETPSVHRRRRGSQGGSVRPEAPEQSVRNRNRLAATALGDGKRL